MRDITPINKPHGVTYLASNTKGRTWMQTYYGTHTISFSLEEHGQMAEFRRAVASDGLTLSAI